MRFERLVAVLTLAMSVGCAPKCEVFEIVAHSQAKVVSVDPVHHATESLQQCFDAMGEDIDTSRLDVAFWGHTYSQVPDARTVRFSSGTRKSFSRADISGQLFLGLRQHACHEAQHVVQAQGRSRLGWWWYYLWNRGRLEREADAAGVKYAEEVN